MLERRPSRGASNVASMSVSASSARRSFSSSTSPRRGSIRPLGDGAWELVDRLRGEGTTIILTTHYMDEAQHLADRVVVINRGEIVASGTPETIGGRSEAAVRIRFALPDDVERRVVADRGRP